MFRANIQESLTYFNYENNYSELNPDEGKKSQSTRVEKYIDINSRKLLFSYK